MHQRRFKLKVLLLSLPALAGFATFFLLPFMRSIGYSFINDTYNKRFVWFDNYKTVLGNEYFQLALRNTFVFSLIGVTLLVAVSISLSLLLLRLSDRLSFIKNFFILPMVLPTAGIIVVWRALFYVDSYYYLMKDAPLNGFFQIFPIYLLFLWKNAGINIILIMAAFTQIPREVCEAAELDGARGFRMYRSVTLPLMSPSLFFVFVLSFVNSLKIFKESYLFYRSDYPPDVAYTVQYYMNNHFNKLNYQNLTAGSLIFTLLIAVLILAAYRAQNRFMRDLM